MRYAAGRDTESLPSIQRVLAIPTKRFSRPLLGFLTREEMGAIPSAPLRRTWSGERDHVHLSTLYNTGARVSELPALKVSDVDLDRSQSIRVLGKGAQRAPDPTREGDGEGAPTLARSLAGRGGWSRVPQPQRRPPHQVGAKGRISAVLSPGPPLA
jgi:integrase